MYNYLRNGEQISRASKMAYYTHSEKYADIT